MGTDRLRLTLPLLLAVALVAGTAATAAACPAPPVHAAGPAAHAAGLAAPAAGSRAHAAGAPTAPPRDAPDPRIADGSAQRDLDAARERWRSLGVRSYRMRVRLSCFCPRETTRPRTVVVRGGRIGRGIPLPARAYASVPRLFARVQRAIDDRVAQLDVTYGARDGVPRSIAVDVSRMIADEEMGATIDRFRRLP